MNNQITRPQIREVFMRNGFNIDPDRDDLEDRVFEAAFELLELSKPAAEREPLDCEDCGGEGEVWHESGAYAGICATCRGDGEVAAPQPAEQRSAPDVAGLVEALECCETWFSKHSPTAPLINGHGDAEHPMMACVREALAAHRSQGGEVSLCPSGS